MIFPNMLNSNSLCFRYVSFFVCFSGYVEWSCTYVRISSYHQLENMYIHACILKIEIRLIHTPNRTSKLRNWSLHDSVFLFLIFRVFPPPRYLNIYSICTFCYRNCDTTYKNFLKWIHIVRHIIYEQQWAKISFLWHTEPSGQNKSAHDFPSSTTGTPPLVEGLTLTDWSAALPTTAPEEVAHVGK